MGEDETDHVVLRDPEAQRAEGSAVARVLDAHPAGAGGLREPHGLLGRGPHHEVPEAVAAVEHARRGGLAVQDEFGIGKNAAGFQPPHIVAESRDAVGVGSAQSGFNQIVGHVGGVGRAQAAVEEDVGNDAAE